MINLAAFLEKVKNGDPVSFHETILVITENYDYTPTGFSNGLGEEKVNNAAGANEGSCKIFAFAKLHNLDPQQTLGLFGDYYRTEVLLQPDGTNHQNVRSFIKFGWEGIDFNGQALQLRKAI